MDFGIASVAAITVLAYLLGLAWKTSSLEDKWIPIMCGCVGLVLGVLGFIMGVSDFPANNLLDAAAVGVVSGFAATGVHQVGKQLIQHEQDS